MSSERHTHGNDLHDEEVVLLRRGEVEAKALWSGFVDFALQGNILEIAFGLIIANAFTELVREFVSDILMPPFALLVPLRRNIEEKFAVLYKGPNYNHTTGYNTLKQAQDDGAVVMAYGSFISSCVTFFGIGLVLYALALLYSWLTKDPIIKHTRKCEYCRKRCSEKAIRCVNCTSWLDGREDHRPETESPNLI